MKNIFSKLTLVASLGLALAFTFSCSSNGVTDDDGWFGHGQGSSSSSRGGGVSSPGGKSSSSFVNGSSLVNCYFYYEDEMYCIDKSEDYAFTYDECLYIDGTVVSSCKNVGGSSSPSGKSSSSSRGSGSVNSSSSSIPRSSSSAVVALYSSSSIYTGGSCNTKDYRLIDIGKQTWMAENWGCYVAGSLCYNNDPANCKKYGRLYNWDAAITICPKGWHLPDDDEWDELVDFVGGKGAAGLKLKATKGWDNNGNGEDEYGFTALPGGISYSGDHFSLIGSGGAWWSSSVSSPYAYSRYMGNDRHNVSIALSDKNDFFSVRCIMD